MKCTVEITEGTGGGFVKSMLHYATSINADLISIMNFPESSLASILGGGYPNK